MTTKAKTSKPLEPAIYELKTEPMAEPMASVTVNELQRKITIMTLRDHGLEMTYDIDQDILTIAGAPWSGSGLRKEGRRWAGKKRTG